MTKAKKLYIKTYGCQMNVYDSERMSEVLGASGYETTITPDDADMILLNTCHIREKAAEKIYSELGRFKGLKAAKPDLKIGVAGCVAQAEGAEIIRRQPMVDLVVGPQNYHKLGALEAAVSKGVKAIDTEFPQEDKFDKMAGRAGTNRAPTAFLTVQEGCDKFCSFCVVPYTRGVENSRPAQKLIDEARQLVDGGVREITLLGQNVNAYHGQGAGGATSLADLIYSLADIDGLARIRYTTSHPNDMSDDLISAHVDCAKLMPYLHLPVQSGSDTVLKAMNRKHTASGYLRLIEKIRKARPDILLSGDFIVGFPGETDADFADTMKLVQAVGYGQSYSFKYSPRPGTPAAEKPEVDEKVKSDRLQQLQKLLTQQQRAAQDGMIGKEVSVLFEKPGRLEGQLVGKSEYLQAVHVSGPSTLIGGVHKVHITESQTNSISGTLA
ncbi:MAG: tRNA (N6-isopentenyl adenosine(37)-C2)-methylthiotransferase MiaB [Paracoccaceae bacterium]